LESFSYELQLDMHSYLHKKIYSCKNWVLHFRLKFGGKICYFDCLRRFLPLDHSFRLDSNAFKKGNIILEGPPRRLSGLEIPDMLDNLVLKKMGMSL
jgi:hypothetical protein